MGSYPWSRRSLHRFHTSHRRMTLVLSNSHRSNPPLFEAGVSWSILAATCHGNSYLHRNMTSSSCISRCSCIDFRWHSTPTTADHIFPSKKWLGSHRCYCLWLSLVFNHWERKPSEIEEWVYSKQSMLEQSSSLQTDNPSNLQWLSFWEVFLVSEAYVSLFPFSLCLTSSSVIPYKFEHVAIEVA